MVWIEPIPEVFGALVANLQGYPNQIAFLYPSLGSGAVAAMREALEERGLKVYAPRAGSFMEQEESLLVFGIYLLIFFYFKAIGGYKPLHMAEDFTGGSPGPHQA